MQNLYHEVTSLDKRSVELFGLTEEIMMEHAADALAKLISTRFASGSSVLIVCGSGNNGADGLALARLLEGKFKVSYHLPAPAKSPLCALQNKRLEKLGLTPSAVDGEYDIIVDALFGSGLSRPLNAPMQKLLNALNTMKATKIACDVPSGLFPDGSLDTQTFCADITLTMGGQKRGLYSDAAKEIVGEVIVADLGIDRRRYEIPSTWKLLERCDLIPPYRIARSSHKGSFGHLALICGEKTGASIIAASAALRFGTGLVSLISNENVILPHELMQSHSIPSTTTAIALGMGLGTEFCDDELSRITDNTYPLVLDADIFYHPMFLTLIQRPNIVLTPHPKEFLQILRACKIADIDIQTLQNNRFEYAERFCEAYPNTVLILKGANVIIAHRQSYFINPHGTVAMAKGGSGDVLSGLVGALLAQGYDPIDAAIQASLAHTESAQKFSKNNYALTPYDLIEGIATL